MGECRENTVDLGPWNAEHVGDPMSFQGLHQEFSAIHDCFDGIEFLGTDFPEDINPGAQA